jgi:hypothetical protein
MNMIWWVITRICDKDEPHITFPTHESYVSNLIPQVNGYGRFHPKVIARNQKAPYTPVKRFFLLRSYGAEGSALERVEHVRVNTVLKKMEA